MRRGLVREATNDPKLTLEKAVMAARQRETVKKQQTAVRGDNERKIPSIDALHYKQPYKGKPIQWESQQE